MHEPDLLSAVLRLLSSWAGKWLTLSATCFLRFVFPQVLNIPGVEQHCLLLWGPGSNWICLQWVTFPSFGKDSLKFLFNLSSFYQRCLSSFMALLAESVCLFNLSLAFWLGFFLKYYCRFCRTGPSLWKRWNQWGFRWIKYALFWCILTTTTSEVADSTQEMTDVKFWLTTILPASPLACLFACLLSWFHYFPGHYCQGQKRKKNLCPFKIYPGFFVFFFFFLNLPGFLHPSPLNLSRRTSDLSWNSCSKSSCSSASSAGHKSHLSLFSGPGIPKGSLCILFSVVLPPSLGWVSLGPRHPLYTRKFFTLVMPTCSLAVRSWHVSLPYSSAALDFTVSSPLPSVQSVTKISLFLRVSALPLVNRYVLVILSSTAPILIVRPECVFKSSMVSFANLIF